MVSLESGHPVVWVSEQNYKFRLSAMQAPLLEWLSQGAEPSVAAASASADTPTADGTGSEAAKESCAVVLPLSRLREVESFVRGGLNDLSVSRLASKVAWGLPVPADPAHSIYVWLDALSNYLTVAARGGKYDLETDTEIPPDADWREVFPHWPVDVHIVGKDILRFHAVYWPAFLLAAGLPPPRRIVAHAHWTVDRVKMSKSLGNVVNPSDYTTAKGGLYSVDAVRYFLLREGSLRHDSDFNGDCLKKRCVAECSSSLGNLVSRTVTAKMLPGGVLPLPDPNATGAEALSLLEAAYSEPARELVAALTGLQEFVDSCYERANPAEASERLMEVIALANRAVSAGEPWKFVSKGGAAASDANPAEAAEVERARRVRLCSVLYPVLETVRIVGILSAPVMPDTTDRLLRALLGDGCAAGDKDRAWSAARYGAVLPPGYSRVDVSSALLLFPPIPYCPPPQQQAASAAKQQKGPAKAKSAASPKLA
jgi:methionyl-tRNA synthetase